MWNPAQSNNWRRRKNEYYATQPLYAIGGNTGIDHGWCGNWLLDEVGQIREVADRLWYALHKKPKRRR
jgi:hypothetical protein